MDCASVALVCLCLTLTLGSRSQPTFIQTSTDLQLTVTKEVQKEDLFIWKFKNNNIIRLSGDTIITHDDYKDRVEFFPQNLSLILKSVQLSDSGIYTAETFQEEDLILSTHDVTVQAPVSPVLLSVDSVFNSPESCNFTVSCTTELSPSISRSFTCDRRTCEEASPAPSDPAPSLHLYLSDVSIICNHSNHVSWRKDTTEIQQVCPFGTEESDDKLKGTADIGATVVVIVVVIVLILCLICPVVVVGVVVLRKRRKSHRIIWENTVYGGDVLLPSPHPSIESLTSVYCEAQPRPGPAPAQNPDSV